MYSKKLFHRDFTLMILGQIASLFGNSILRFALSLYVLNKTGSAAAFGTVLAVSMIPTVVLSPLGGVLADRFPRQAIMVVLDYSTAALIGTFFAVFRINDSLIIITIVMVLLSIIQSFYQPSVQSSIPSLASEKNLMQANGVVMQVNALANLVGPVLGGVFYGLVGIYPILIASCVCFFLSATMELFLRIPFTRPENKGNFFRAIADDLREASHFLSKGNPLLLKILFIVAGLNLFLSSMIIVGLPFLVKIFLGMTDQQYGFAEASLAVGSILGGLLAGVAAKKLTVKRSYLFLLGASLALLPLGLSVFASPAAMLTYIIILISVLACMCCATLFTVFTQTFVQIQTPTHLLGKVAAFISMISLCVSPFGQAGYGILFDLFKNASYLVIFFTAAISIVLSMTARHFFLQLKDGNETAPLPKSEIA